MSLLRPAGSRPTVCYCPPDRCQAPKPEWCIGKRASDTAQAAPADYPPPSDVVSKEQALEALEDLDDFSRMTVGIAPTGQHATLRRFIEQSGRERVSADPLPQPRHDDGSPAPEDFIAKSKRILAAVDLYHEAPNSTNRTNLRMVIWHQLEAAAAQSQPLVEPTRPLTLSQGMGLIKEYGACDDWFGLIRAVENHHGVGAAAQSQEGDRG